MFIHVNKSDVLELKLPELAEYDRSIHKNHYVYKISTPITQSGKLYKVLHNDKVYSFNKSNGALSILNVSLSNRIKMNPNKNEIKNLIINSRQYLEFIYKSLIAINDTVKFKSVVSPRDFKESIELDSSSKLNLVINWYASDHTCDFDESTLVVNIVNI